MIRRSWFPLLLGAALALALAFLVLPVVAIFTHTAPGRLVDRLGDPAATDALRLSLETTAIAVAIIVAVGTPAAYLLATRTFRGRALLTTLVELPLVLPPAVAGIALLASLGATLMFAGSFRGVTQTVPLAIYDQFATDFPAALALSAILVAVSAGLLLAVKLVPGPTTVGRALG